MTTGIPGQDRTAPLHHQVATAMQEKIRTGRLPVGSRLPSERSLSIEFGVSRVTVRHALKELERQGIVDASSGLRWVTQPQLPSDAVEEGVNGLVSFADLNAARGLQVTSKVLRALTRPGSIDEAESLGVAPGAGVFELVRLRSVEGVPVVVDYTLLPTSIAPDIEVVDFAVESLYQTLANSYGCRPRAAEYAVEARRADVAHAALLELEPGDPVLEAWQTTYDDHSRIIQVCHLVYRGDRYRFRAFLERAGTGIDLARRTPAESLGTHPASATNSATPQ